jgi:hypothetical protein
MVRGKRKIGYELEIKVKFDGQGKKEGSKITLGLKEICDDGSDPEGKITINAQPKEDKKNKDSSTLLKREI